MPRTRATLTIDEDVLRAVKVRAARTGKGGEADIKPDPPSTLPMRSPGPADEYLIALAQSTTAVIVSGVAHLLGLADQLPVFTPAAFLRLLEDDAD